MRSKTGSVSSDGSGLGDEDEEPFSATASSIAVHGPKQDTLPRRPQAGGRFPSDLQVNAERGLQAPLSPSSGSSSFGDVQDGHIVAASALPGSGVGQHYGDAFVASPTHAAIVNAQAEQDGINPYTYEPIQYSIPHSGPQNESEVAEAGAATGEGVVAGAAGAKAYSYYKGKDADHASNYLQPQQHGQAVIEASNVAAPDTYELQLEQQAAQEALVIAAPDVPRSADMISGAGSQDESNLATTGALQPGQADATEVGLQTEPAPVDVARPAMTPSTVSVTTISQLHVPGEYPK